MNIPIDLVTEIRYIIAIDGARKVFRDGNRSNKRRALVLHLYYQDMWPYFSNKIAFLLKNDFDLVISLPAKDEISNSILEDYPNAVIIKVPNKGRDVLPFLKIGKLLSALGYEYVLKLHSKKSPQREDGKDWADKMISDLVPQSSQKVKQIIDTLSEDATSIIGPAGNYVPLTTYYNDNQPKVTWMLSEMVGQKAASYINEHNDKYGFFAGTMFWIKLSAIKPVFEVGIWANNFPPESAQLDGTIAHAIERVLCVLPEYSKMKIYEVDKLSIKNIPYKTDFIPEWSDYYHVKNNK